MRKADEKGEGLSDAPLPHTMSLYNRAAPFADVNLATLPCTSACRMFRASAFAIWWHACRPWDRDELDTIGGTSVGCCLTTTNQGWGLLVREHVIFRSRD